MRTSMRLRNYLVSISVAISLLSAAYYVLQFPNVAESKLPTGSDAIKRGEYLVNAGGCISCHQDAAAETLHLSGGLAIESEFGIFYAPNITPDIRTGIGAWSAKEFLLAMQHGRSPGGGFYFPAFPYRSYAGLRDSDVLDIAAYLMSMPPVSSVVPEHETPFWLSSWMMVGWNILADLQDVSSESFDDPELERGAYLARNLGHCGECHTPRNALGIPNWPREFSGAELSDGHVEAIDTAALAGWTKEDFAFFLFVGMTPDGEYVGGEMESVIEHNTSKLTDEDRQALASFFTRSRN